MLIEAARRAEAAAKEMLALVTEASVSCAEILEALAVSKAIAGVNSAFQVAGAAAVAGRERHGDGGAEVLAASAGLSRREAHSQVKTAEALRKTQKLRDAVAEGRVPIANAKRLAEAVEKTSVGAVDSDGELLAKAESMRPEQFAREARRWVTDRDGDGGESEHARQRARRCVRVWDGDDGMVHLHGQFDSVTGRRIGNRLRAESARMFDADKKSSEDSGERRSFPQCMADALDNLTATNKNAGGGGKPIADICVVAHVDDATGKLIAEIPGGDRLPPSVLEELACGAEITPAIYNTRGALLWQGHSKRTATSTQLKALRALHGGCFACGADFEMCQAHHVKPVSEGGPTNVDNMVPACWGCHNKIHYFGWQIHGPPGQRTLHPPDSVTHASAHASEQPLLHVPGIEHASEQPLLHVPGIEHASEQPLLHVPGIEHASEQPLLHVPGIEHASEQPLLPYPSNLPSNPSCTYPASNTLPSNPSCTYPASNTLPSNPSCTYPASNTLPTFHRGAGPTPRTPPSTHLHYSLQTLRTPSGSPDVTPFTLPPGEVEVRPARPWAIPWRRWSPPKSHCEPSATATGCWSSSARGRAPGSTWPRISRCTGMSPSRS